MRDVLAWESPGLGGVAVMEQHSLLHLRQQKPHSSSLTRPLDGPFLVLSFLHGIKIDFQGFLPTKDYIS